MRFLSLIFSTESRLWLRVGLLKRENQAAVQMARI